MRLLLFDPAAAGLSPVEVALAELAATGKLLVACPYLNLSFLNETLPALDHWRLITDIEAWLASVPHDRRQAITAWWSRHADHVRHLSRLHAKVFIGRGAAVVGSANWTDAGLFERVEAGVMVEDVGKVTTLENWFESCWQAASNLDDATLQAAIKRAPAYTRVTSPARNTLLNNAPARRTHAYSYIRNRPVGDEAARVASCLRPLADRVWAETYFDWVRNVIEFTGLPEGDRQLTLTLKTKDRAIGVNVNNRSVLTWNSRGGSPPPAMWYLLDTPYAERLKARFPNEVRRCGPFSRVRNETVPPSLLVADFPPPAVFGIDEFKTHWQAAIETEFRRERGHSPGAAQCHVPLLYHLATDAPARARVFDAAFAAAHDGFSSSELA